MLGVHSYAGAVNQIFDPEVEVGNYSQIANGVTFIGGGEHPSSMDKQVVANFPFCEKLKRTDYPATGSRGLIKIGSDVWIGENATLLSGATIEDGVIVGACAVVRGHVPPYAVVIGNPARIVHNRFDNETIMKLLKIKWWDWPDELVQNRLLDMIDINKFIDKYYYE